MFINLSAINEFLTESVVRSNCGDGYNYSDGYYRPFTVDCINPRLTEEVTTKKNINKKGVRK